MPSKQWALISIEKCAGTVINKFFLSSSEEHPARSLTLATCNQVCHIRHMKTENQL